MNANQLSPTVNRSSLKRALGLLAAVAVVGGIVLAAAVENPDSVRRASPPESPANAIQRDATPGELDPSLFRIEFGSAQHG